MPNSISILFLLVGRGGSKGVPGKNLRTIGGLSLLGYKAVSARRSRHCDRIILSSDSEEIQAEALRHGVEVLFTRPAELASDTASSDDVVLHAMDFVERSEGRSYDAVMLLEPSSPFARADHYDAAIDLFVARQADLVVSMRETEVASVFVGQMEPDGSIAKIVDNVLRVRAGRRQDQTPDTTMNGALYLIRWETLRKTRKIYSTPNRSYGLLMDRLHSIEIESLFDLAFAETVVAQRLLDLSPWR
jgi:CMP-N-acetylneuraminic acid synthetase